MITSLPQYYQDSAVRARMLEYLGGSSVDEATCVYITVESFSSGRAFEPLHPGVLWSKLACGMDIMRSLWDRQALVVHLDLEYVNFDFPGEPYLEPDRSFALQAPVVRTLQEMLLEYGIAPLHLLSGRGHHLVWRVRRDSTAFGELAGLTVLPPALRSRYAAPQLPYGEPVSPGLGAAHTGAGLVLEYLAHTALRAAQPQCEIPIALTAVETHQRHRGREIISIDLSEYGDPLHTRIVRIPFSAYQKPQQQRREVGDHVLAQIPPLFVIPLSEMPTSTACRSTVGTIAMTPPAVSRSQRSLTPCK